MDKPPTPILDSKDNHLEPTSSLTSNSSGNTYLLHCPLNVLISKLIKKKLNLSCPLNVDYCFQFLPLIPNIT